MSIVVSKTRLPVTQWQTESGSVVSVANARRRDAKSAVVTLEPIQDLSHGDPSPTNLCPISGHSAVTLNHAGTSQSDNPTSITVSLGQTVYGGSIDLVSGVGTVTKVADDLSLLSWTTRKTGTVNKLLSATLSNYYKPTNTTYAKIGMIAEDYVECGAYNASGLQTNIETASVGLYSFKTSSAQSNVIYAVIAKDSSPSGKVVYPLATTLTFQLSTTQIAMLERNNTLWAEEGDISVTYARIHS